MNQTGGDGNSEVSNRAQGHVTGFCLSGGALQEIVTHMQPDRALCRHKGKFQTVP